MEKSKAHKKVSPKKLHKLILVITTQFFVEREIEKAKIGEVYVVHKVDALKRPQTKSQESHGHVNFDLGTVIRKFFTEV